MAATATEVAHRLRRPTLPVFCNTARWVRAFRLGILPQLDEEALVALYVALNADDSRIIQGATLEPPALEFTEMELVESCCPLAFCIWQGEEMTVSELEGHWCDMLATCDKLAYPRASRDFLRWWDATPRHLAVKALCREVLYVWANRPCECDPRSLTYEI